MKKGCVSLKTQINSVKKRNFVVFLMRYPLEVARFRAEIVDLANVGVLGTTERESDDRTKGYNRKAENGDKIPVFYLKFIFN